MGKRKLDANSLMELDDGKVLAALNRHIRDVANDIEDRGADGHKRSVTLTIDFAPVVNSGEVYDIKTEVSIRTGLPARRTRPISMTCQRSREGAVMLFNDESPDDVRQGTLDEARQDTNS